MNLLTSNDKSFPYLTVATGAVFIWALFQSFTWNWWLLSLFGYFLVMCCGVSVMFHRCLTHKSFKTQKWIEKLFTFFGAMGGTGSSLGWVAVHRVHHRYSDKVEDPHSPHTGSIWGIFVNKYNFKFNKWVIRDLLVDPFHLFLHKNYYAILAAYFALLLLISFKLFLFFGVLPMFYVFVASAVTVILGHMHGYRTYNLNDKSSNSWIAAYLVWGEGWHNNHHRFPRKWLFQNKWWEIDFSSYIVRAIKC